MQEFTNYAGKKLEEMLDEYEEHNGEKHPASDLIIEKCSNYILGDTETIILIKKNGEAGTFEYDGGGVIYNDYEIEDFLGKAGE